VILGKGGTAAPTHRRPAEKKKVFPGQGVTVSFIKHGSPKSMAKRNRGRPRPRGSSGSDGGEVGRKPVRRRWDGQKQEGRGTTPVGNSVVRETNSTPRVRGKRLKEGGDAEANGSLAISKRSP